MKISVHAATGLSIRYSAKHLTVPVGDWASTITHSLISPVLTMICLDNAAVGDVYLLPLLLKSGAVQCGGLAQLGERFNGIEEVNGSIPLSSTSRLLLLF